MLAARLPSILPPLSAVELLEVSMIHSVARQLSGRKLSDRRPFRTSLSTKAIFLLNLHEIRNPASRRLSHAS